MENLLKNQKSAELKLEEVRRKLGAKQRNAFIAIAFVIIFALLGGLWWVVAIIFALWGVTEVVNYFQYKSAEPKLANIVAEYHSKVEMAKLDSNK